MRIKNDDIEILVADLTCDDTIKCQRARRELVAKGARSIDALVRALSNKKPMVRWEAAKALGQIGDRTAAEALVASLEDPEFDVQWLAAEGLINIGHGSLEPLLAALVDHGDKSLFLRRGAHHVLHDMKRGRLDKTLQPVMTAVEDTAPAVEVLQVAEKALEVIRGR